VLDSSAIFATIDRADANHRIATDLLKFERGPLIIATPALAEICYLVERRFGVEHLCVFLQDIEDGAYMLDCCVPDIPRVQELVKKYADMPLGFADASVIACAERRGGRVLSFDLRHFGVVAREGRIQLLH
jgi:predicted nucleic acid-binding protein